jgi:hypothetical protein
MPFFNFDIVIENEPGGRRRSLLVPQPAPT